MEGTIGTYSNLSKNFFTDVPQRLDSRKGALTMNAKRVNSEIAQLALDDLRRKSIVL